MSQPAEILSEGMAVLATALLPLGFQPAPITGGHSSGGEFATSQFVRGDRVLELHYRNSLGMVRYHVGSNHAAHESYMREVAPKGQSSYPGFSSEPLAAFEDLKRDLEQFCGDFLTGNAAVLLRAAEHERAEASQSQYRLNVESSGDMQRRQEAREAFRRQDYHRVVVLLDHLKYPEDLSRAEQRLREVAQQRSAENTGGASKARGSHL